MAVVEVKAPEEDTPATADGTQVARYWQRYGCVLVTTTGILPRQSAGWPASPP